MYCVNEIQNDTVSSFVYEDKATAFEKFFDVARYIPKSELTIHTVTIANEKGEYQFTPITKSSVS